MTRVGQDDLEERSYRLWYIVSVCKAQEASTSEGLRGAELRT